jgi:site-specific DNA-methyltransferase (adenine-specific)
MAMFPPSIPNYYIQKYSKKGDIVLDQFSGRGTTPLEACMLERIGVGIDRNPLAFVLTKAKVETPTYDNIKRRLSELWGSHKKSSSTLRKEKDWKIKMLFNDYTLDQLLFLRKRLDWKGSSVDAFIASLILGIIHGNSEGFLSISMPNTFSMSPNYVRKYIKENNLVKPKRDVFELLFKKLDRCYQLVPTKGKAYFSDARKVTKLDDNSVSLSVTSPPYTRVIRYGEFNWIRLWFLGYKDKEVDPKLFCSQSLPLYKDFMYGVLEENWRVLKKGGTAIYVIGDVNDRVSGESENLAQFVWENCAQDVGFQLLEPIREDPISDSKKVSKIWGKTKGNATKIDRVLIMKKPY